MSAYEPEAPGTDSLSKEAAYWWVVLNEKTCTAADREAFAKWVRRSPERVEAILWMSMVSSALKEPDGEAPRAWSDIPAEQLIREARESAQVVPLFDRILPARSSSAAAFFRSARVLVSLSVMGLILMLAVWLAPGGVQNYRTVLGEQRSVVLDDGSIVTLNTSSEIEVDYSRERRLIRLLQGEALFEVSHAPQRPFDVVVNGMIVRAVGTKFNVDRRAGRTTVAVVEGTVKVMPQVTASRAGAVAEAAARIVTAAQRIVLTDRALSAPEQIPDVAPLTAWTQRQLVFENRPLAQVAEEFNRYNRNRILIRSAELERREITGVFQANDSYPFLVFIEQIPGVHVDITGTGDYVVTMEEQARSGEGPKVLR